jgi:hypothetical protein
MKKSSVLAGLLLLSSTTANAELVQTKYANVECNTKEQFNSFSKKTNFDLVFEKVRKLLNKSPKAKISIVLCSDQNELSSRYETITGNPTNTPAFVYCNTIYLNLQKLRDGVIAHELVHVFIPSKVDKILMEHMCQFVEKEIQK